jgi:hypothetical protein
MIIIHSKCHQWIKHLSTLKWFLKSPSLWALVCPLNNLCFSPNWVKLLEIGQNWVWFNEIGYHLKDLILIKFDVLKSISCSGKINKLSSFFLYFCANRYSLLIWSPISTNLESLNPNNANLGEKKHFSHLVFSSTFLPYLLLIWSPISAKLESLKLL